MRIIIFFIHGFPDDVIMEAHDDFNQHLLIFPEHRLSGSKTTFWEGIIGRLINISVQCLVKALFTI